MWQPASPGGTGDFVTRVPVGTGTGTRFVYSAACRTPVPLIPGETVTADYDSKVVEVYFYSITVAACINALHMTRGSASSYPNSTAVVDFAANTSQHSARPGQEPHGRSHTAALYPAILFAHLVAYIPDGAHDLSKMCWTGVCFGTVVEPQHCGAFCDMTRQYGRAVCSPSCGSEFHQRRRTPASTHAQRLAGRPGSECEGPQCPASPSPSRRHAVEAGNHVSLECWV
jgi:hypothetical protein